MILTASVALLMAAAQPLTVQPLPAVDPALADAVWAVLEAQDAGAFEALLTEDAELLVDREYVDPSVTSFAEAAEQCDLATPFEWSSNVPSMINPYEAKLSCVGEEGYNKQAFIYLDADNRLVAIEIREPIVIKFDE